MSLKQQWRFLVVVEITHMFLKVAGTIAPSYKRFYSMFRKKFQFFLQGKCKLENEAGF